MTPTKRPPRATAATSESLLRWPCALPGRIGATARDGVLQAFCSVVALAERQPEDPVLVVHDLLHGRTKPRTGRSGTGVSQRQLGDEAEPVDRHRSRRRILRPAVLARNRDELRVRRRVHTRVVAERV